MAMRRRLQIPELSKLEQKYTEAATSHLGPMSAPIAKIAADTAVAASSDALQARIDAAQYQSDAKQYIAAKEAGLIVQMMNIADIDPKYISRDRSDVSGESMEELRRVFWLMG